MKKEIKIALIIAVGFITLLWFEKPLRELLIKCMVDELLAKFIAGIIVRLLLLCFVIYLIFKLNLNKFTGLDSKMQMKNLHAALIALAIIVIGILSNWKIYSSIDLTKLILFITSVITIGFFEEFVFRGMVLPLFIKSLHEKKQVLYLSVILSSFLFGSIHFINLLSQSGNLGGITSQVFFSFSIGVFFGGLMLRTENIIVPSIIHGLVNFAFGAGELKSETIVRISEGVSKGAHWNSIIPTTIFFLFILIGGLFMIRKSDTEVILSRLK